MSTDLEAELQRMLTEMPEPKPEEMIASFDPAAWAFAKGLFKTLVGKGIISVADISAMRADIETTARQFAEGGEVQREAAVNEVVGWLDRYTADLTQSG